MPISDMCVPRPEAGAVTAFALPNGFRFGVHWLTAIAWGAQGADLTRDDAGPGRGGRYGFWGSSPGSHFLCRFALLRERRTRSAAAAARPGS